MSMILTSTIDAMSLNIDISTNTTKFLFYMSFVQQQINSLITSSTLVKHVLPLTSIWMWFYQVNLDLIIHYDTVLWCRNTTNHSCEHVNPIASYSLHTCLILLVYFHTFCNGSLKEGSEQICTYNQQWMSEFLLFVNVVHLAANTLPGV